MSTQAKARVLFALIVALIVWPPVQHVLTRRFEANPWKFFGWAMYCTPAPVPHVAFRNRDDTHELQMSTLLGNDPRRFAAFSKFVDLRRLWGRLHGPDELAQAIFTARPRLEGFLVYVNTVWLSPKTAMATNTVDIYECDRSRPEPCARLERAPTR